MAVEYTLYNLDDLAKIDRIEKIQNKLKTQNEKNIDQIIAKEDCSEINEILNSLKKTIASLIDKSFDENVEGIPICTVGTKTYVEMPYAELEKRMSEGGFIIKGDDGSKFKVASALKKYYP